MKKILITGADSYIGTSFAEYMKNFDGYMIDTIDMIGGSWKNNDFSKYDVVFHVAGIAHSDTKCVSKKIEEKYFAINTDLTIETAKKAKKSGVRQFIFMSSIIVFGDKNECIAKDTAPCPDNFYGYSKLKADISIHKLEDNNFKVVSLRPPMVYGKGCKGNYPRLAKLAKLTPVFPDFYNKRSMLYIENLCEFIRLIIDNNETGYFYPQNEEYVNTSKMVKTIASVNGKRMMCTKIFNPLIGLLIKKIRLLKKVFGSMYYEKSMSQYKMRYNIDLFEESIERTEK